MPEFSSLRQFGAYLRSLQLTLPGAEHRARVECAEIVRDEVDRELGVYQTQDTGSFDPWEELAASTQAARARAGYEPNDPGLVTGTLRDHVGIAVEGQKAAVGVPNELVGGGGPNDEPRDVGLIAQWFEEGTKTQPPRSFLGVAGYRRADEVAATFRDAVGAHLLGMPTNRRRGGEL